MRLLISLSRKLRVHEVSDRARPPKPAPAGTPYRSDRVPDRHALDELAALGQRVELRLDLFVVLFAALFALLVVGPELLHLAEAGHLGNAADGPDHAGQRARGVGAAREAENVDLVGRIVRCFAGIVVEREKGQAALDVALQPGAEHAAQELVDRSAAANPAVVVDDLLDAVRSHRLQRLPDPHHVGGLVRVGERVPGAVKT